MNADMMRGDSLASALYKSLVCYQMPSTFLHWVFYFIFIYLFLVFVVVIVIVAVKTPFCHCWTLKITRKSTGFGVLDDENDLGWFWCVKRDCRIWIYLQDAKGEVEMMLPKPDFTWVPCQAKVRFCKHASHTLATLCSINFPRFPFW